jgi:hypothetical protein
MTMSSGIQFTLYGESVGLGESKVRSNDAKVAFQRMAMSWRDKVSRDYTKLFSGLDDLYRKSEEISTEIRISAIDEGMKILASHEIFDLSAKVFYEQFMAGHDNWDEDFDVIGRQYEAIVEKTAELDAYRTARRQNRRKWVGYGSKKAVYSADADNMISNVGHGAFNLVAKGITAIGNSMKKDEIFKNPKTARQLEAGISNLIMAAYQATIDAVKSRKSEAIYRYTGDEESKVEAIVENIEKGRMPTENVLRSLITAINTYPYNRSIYPILLERFGSDGGALDVVVEYFGHFGLAAEKRKMFDERRSKIALDSLSDCRSNLPKLDEYAKYLGFDGFQGESQRLLKAAIEKEFRLKVKSVDLNSLAACRENISLLENYAAEIGYVGFETEKDEILRRAVFNDFSAEVAKFQFLSLEDCDLHFPKLEMFASEIGYDGFSAWSSQTRAKVAEKIAKTHNSKEVKVLGESDKANESRKALQVGALIGAMVIGLLAAGAPLNDIFFGAFAISFLSLLVGLVSPSKVLVSGVKTRGQVLKVYGLLLIISFIAFGMTTE